MKILFIGNINSTMYLNGHAKWLKKKYGNEAVIDLFSTHPAENRKVNEHLLFDNIYYAFTKNLLAKIPGAKRHLFMRWHFFLLPNNYDIIQIHFVSPFLKTIAPFFHLKTKKVVASLWGSDFNALSTIKKKKIGKSILKYTDAVTLGNPEMLNQFKEFYNNEFQNLNLCYFGNDLIEQMQVLNTTSKIESKKQLQFDTNKITITLSYNASENNQHLKILDSIKTNEYFLSKKELIEFILPLTYGGSHSYIESIKNKLSELPFPFHILDSFLPSDKVFHLRNATDIFIHLPINDALSGSLREHLFAKNIVITGNWLPYNILTNNSIYFHQIKSIHELPQQLTEIVNNIAVENQACLNNPAMVYNISSWQVVINNWVKLYNEILRN